MKLFKNSARNLEDPWNFPNEKTQNSIQKPIKNTMPFHFSPVAIFSLFLGFLFPVIAIVLALFFCKKDKQTLKFMVIGTFFNFVLQIFLFFSKKL